MKYIARSIYHVLDRLCSLVDWSPVGCGLLNRTIYLGYDEDRDEFRWEIPNRVTYPLFCWALDNGWPA